MLIPLRTEIHSRRRPIATQIIVVLNVLVYLAAVIGERAGVFESRATLAAWGHLDAENFKLWQLITYQFLHDPNDMLHVAFNMLFLWVFGTAVESRFNALGFAAFYLGAGTMAGLVHMLVTDSPVIGASGSVAGVSGAFLALFPRAHVRVLLWFFIIGVYSIPAMWFIGFYFVVDLLNQTMDLLGSGDSSVAYAAHLGGYVFGFGIAMLLLRLGIVPRGEFDMVRLWQQASRRAKFRALTRHDASGSWESSSADTGVRMAQARAREMIREKRAEVMAAPSESEVAMALRTTISSHLTNHDLPAAAQVYREFHRLAPEAVLQQSQQLDVANQFSAEGDFTAAADAYEAMLKRYPNAAQANEVRLMLGLIYSRHVRRPDRAREIIMAVRKNLSDASQRGLADQLLAELGS